MSQVWDITTPVGTEAISNGDDRLREMKAAIQAALQGQTTEGLEAIFPGSAPTTAPVFRYRGLKDITGNRPTAGQYGLFFDTTRQVLQRDNGLSWDDIATNIPSGTVSVFYQASAPTGWTAVAVNDKFLRVVTAGGTGGTTGGSVAASSSLGHTHTMGNHTHSTPNHQHNIGAQGAASYTSAGGTHLVVDGAGEIVVSGGAGTTPAVQRLTEAGEGGGTSGTPSSNTSDSTAIGQLACADVVIATKS